MKKQREEKFWSKFKEDKPAIFGLFTVVLLLFVAIYAPLIANGRPFLLLDRTTGEVSYPFLRYIFAPDSTETTIEIICNYFMLFLPLYGIIELIFHRAKLIKYLLLSVAAIALLIPFSISKSRIDKTDYRKLAEDKNLFAVFAVIPYGPYEQIAEPYEKPSKKHILGTDDIGRSLASRIIYGARISLSVGIFSSLIAMLIGSSIGLYIGYFKGKTDLFAMRIIEIISCFPTFLLLLILMALLKDNKIEQSVILIIPVIGLTSWVGLTLLVRGEVLKQSALPYIVSCKSLGIPLGSTLFRHLLPNVFSIVLISFAFSVAGAILAESSLSFLGFGVQQPCASWGGLLRQSFEDPLSYWHLTIFPGVALFLAVIGFNFAGEGVRRAMDSKG
ncbi:MAG: ABC transporter permease [Lentisphaeria bacterium]|nr:ABC transporter permease [Lentisphaeria bacterium]